jgi:hypothetical protein
MAIFKTEFNSVSHGETQFFAGDGVVDIPDEHVPAFRPLIDSGELVPVESETTDVPAEKSLEETDDKPKRSKKA